ncbi:unnamed protein product [Linum tenue]|uniref:Uncharacterized protein n=1 Tax=Linum tenue TaxID=586396 RepID=A0AAV0QQI5_9ROSI|nr:unnamed protein product [Linum tenue]
MVALTFTFFSLELITQAASSSVVVFFFCNVIIVTILVASRPPPPAAASGICHVSVAGSPYATIYQHEETVIDGHRHTLHSNDENRASESNLKFVITTHQEEVEEEKEKEEEEEVGEYNEEEDDDELRRRVEEFIEKTNNEWRAELLRTSRRP